MAGTSSGRSVDVKSGTPDTPTTTNKSTIQSKPRKKLSPAEKTAMAALATLIEDIAAHKSKAAFKKLFEYFAPRLKGYLMRLGSSEAQAEELVQDVMLTVWRKAALFDRRKAAASTWLFTIARNRRIDILRREKYPELDPEDPALVPDEEVATARGICIFARQASR